ncbi:hypothetical protein HMI54_015102 [Coelomomyces lativittatus]|nr:hypothetical protein HMI56_004866 [Coelomomyces lativittatus]KAJ1513309.1 hypothetical protein HMI54_015102 [Coelomomyces lativittatus]
MANPSSKVNPFLKSNKQTIQQKSSNCFNKQVVIRHKPQTQTEAENSLCNAQTTKKSQSLKPPAYDTSSEARARYLRAREKAFEVGLSSRRVNDYDPLLDECLQDYFSSPSIRKHLRRLGIV